MSKKKSAKITRRAVVPAREFLNDLAGLQARLGGKVIRASVRGDRCLVEYEPACETQAG